MNVKFIDRAFTVMEVTRRAKPESYARLNSAVKTETRHFGGGAASIYGR